MMSSNVPYINFKFHFAGTISGWPYSNKWLRLVPALYTPVHHPVLEAAVPKMYLQYSSRSKPISNCWNSNIMIFSSNYCSPTITNCCSINKTCNYIVVKLINQIKAITTNHRPQISKRFQIPIIPKLRTSNQSHPFRIRQDPNPSSFDPKPTTTIPSSVNQRTIVLPNLQETNWIPVRDWCAILSCC